MIKRKREVEIVDTMHINGLQKFESQANILNPVDIDIENEKYFEKENALEFQFLI